MSCHACPLGRAVGKNSMGRYGRSDAPLAIFLDSPDSRAEQLLAWIILSMGLTDQDVCVDYIFKCTIPKIGNPIAKKADRTPAMKKCHELFERPGFVAQQIVCLGNIAYEAFSDVSKVTEMQGRYDQKHQVWVSYGPLYLLMNPGECLRTWRVIYRAAELAGLKPQFQRDFPKFDFPTR